MIVYLYCDKRSVNDATTYYVDLMVKPLIERGYEYKIVHALHEIQKPDIILTITAKYFFMAKIRHPRCKTIYWAQGVSAAEAKMSINSIKAYNRYLYRAITEPIAVRNSDVLFCVSERMLQYYSETCRMHNDSKCIIMPCYNLPLSDRFIISQYKEPTFVYAGGFNIWQGIDFMMEVYSKVEKAIPNCRITILSNQKEQFKDAVSKYNILHYDIKYVPLDHLSDELHKHKYGFIIRDNNIVNNVSTPTKMNSYLSNYIIPVFSDAVDSFVKHIDLGQYQLMVNCPLDSTEAAEKIIQFERGVKDYAGYCSVVEKVFATYYNDSLYIDIINKKYSELLFQ